MRASEDKRLKIIEANLSYAHRFNPYPANVDNMMGS